MQKIWRILSIDGGGIRGIIPANILAFIEKRTGKPISQLFDLVAGTSTGGILALGLAKPDTFGKPEFTAQHLCELYEISIPHIFRNPRSWWGNLLSPKYKSFAFQEILKHFVGDCRLKSALTDVIIPCYDIEHRLPYVFKSRLAKMESASDFRMRDVALATSASPTLFHPVCFPKSSTGRIINLVDGGVFANNPAIIALSDIKSLSAGKNDKYFVVSIGTGKSTQPLTDEFVSLWGYVQWSRPMLELVMESISESVHEQMQSLLLPNDEEYYRLQVNLPRHTNPAIDNASRTNMQALDYAAKNFCSDKRHELDKLCEKLLNLSNTENKSTT
jgi:patatin-like phospholipase/acyl hydrolase